MLQTIVRLGGAAAGHRRVPAVNNVRRLAVGLLVVAAMFGGINASADETRVPLPNVVIEKGEKCVKPKDDMRRNHMKYILHQRDKTMREGIRTKDFSLKNCVDCHANPKTNSVLGEDGFCESCHTYASVKTDCFSCHSDSPEEAALDVPGSQMASPHADTTLGSVGELSDRRKAELAGAFGQMRPERPGAMSNTGANEPVSDGGSQ